MMTLHVRLIHTWLDVGDPSDHVDVLYSAMQPDRIGANKWGRDLGLGSEAKPCKRKVELVAVAKLRK
jgi:hypothetical protein